MCGLAFVAGVPPLARAQTGSSAIGSSAIGPSPIACALTRQGIYYHISCDVLRGLVEVKNVRINDGGCQTMQSYYQSHPKELTRMRRMLGDEVSTFDYQGTYQAGAHFMIYLMACDVHRYSLETNSGVWGWYATGN
jgi:hypothetical protein